MKDILLKLAGILMASVLAFGLIGVYYYDKGKTQERFNAWNEFEKSTADMRDEIESLNQQIQELSTPITYFGDRAAFSVGFFGAEKNDMEYIRQKAKQFGFKPVLIFSTDTELATMRTAVNAADEAWEIMLQIPTAPEINTARVATAKQYLAGLGRPDCSVAFCRTNSLSTDDIDKIKKLGFEGFTINVDSPTSGQAENGLIYINYHYVSGEYDVIDKRLAQGYTNKASMIFVFDMKNMRDEKLSDEKISDSLTKLAECADMEGAAFSTLSDTVEAMSNVNEKIAELQKECDAKIAAAQARIDEINKAIKSLEPKL